MLGKRAAIGNPTRYFRGAKHGNAHACGRADRNGIEGLQGLDGAMHQPGAQGMRIVDFAMQVFHRVGVRHGASIGDRHARSRWMR